MDSRYKYVSEINKNQNLFSFFCVRLPLCVASSLTDVRRSPSGSLPAPAPLFSCPLVTKKNLKRFLRKKVGCGLSGFVTSLYNQVGR